MRSRLRILVCAGAAACALALPNFAAAATIGSLAPHDMLPGQAARPSQQWVADPSTHCIAADPDYDPADSISWPGRCRKDGMIYGLGTLTFLNKGRVVETINGTFADGMPQPGRVVATWSDGTKYEGGQLGFLFNGTGKFFSPKGDAFDGEWKLGVLNGKASAVWANGDRYDGEWKNGRSDGQGVEVWADGRRFEGEWRDGAPLAPVEVSNSSDPSAPNIVSASAGNGMTVASASAIPAPQASAQPAVKPASFVTPVANAATPPVAPTVTRLADATNRGGQASNIVLPLRSLMGASLTAVDGATLELSTANGGFERSLVMPNGNSQEMQFAFANGPVGTVANGNKAIGVFRARSGQLDIDYADGTTESIGDAGNGGLFDRARTIDGRAMCTAWYPQGHVFSDAEKRVAVQEYANRLGVEVSAPSAKHPPNASGETCGGAFIASGYEQKRGDADATSTPTGNPGVARAAAQRAPLNEQLPRLSPDPAVAVKTSAAQPVDNPLASPLVAPRLEQASFTPGAALAPTNTAPAVQPGASDCLSVTSNGEYWGFQNRCEKSVQFAYCEMSDANPLTACKRASVSGSVAANSFSALVGDRSLSEKSVNHEFRWMACDGGAGEVVPHLDRIDPPSGRCERALSRTE
jgi:hypothetical protein